MAEWDFQLDDVKKLYPYPSVLNASEMGSGKTYFAIELDQTRRAATDSKPKTLIVAKLRALEDPWAPLLEENGYRVDVIDPKRRDDFIRHTNDRSVNVHLMHWQGLALMPELQKIPWFHIIADEIHRGKNRKAKQTKALKKLKTQYKTGLSGTPADNMADNIWSVLNWLYPRKFSSYWRFYQEFIDYEVIQPWGYHKIKGIRKDKLDAFHEMVDPYYVRHLKLEQCCTEHPQGVMPWLPEKYYSTVHVELDPAQRRAYNQMEKDMISWVGANEDQPLVAPVVVAKATRLQQFAVAHARIEIVTVNKKRVRGKCAACDNWSEWVGHTPKKYVCHRCGGPLLALLTDKVPVREEKVFLSEPSSKLDAVMEILEDNPDDQFVVFSRFEQLISLLRTRLHVAEIACGFVTGKEPVEASTRAVAEFQAGRLRVVGCTITAGGESITLNKANKVIFLDREWNPSVNKQAEDRLHRGGQKNPVQVIDIVANNTVDMGREQRIEEKWQWLRELFGDVQSKG